MTGREISNLVAEFQADRTPEHRYASFDYCFNYFRGFRNRRLRELAAKENLEKSCLHLGFYLASWGMFRGSGKLGQELNLRHFRNAVKEISSWNSRHPFGALWELDADSYGDPEKRRLLIDCYRQIHDLITPVGQDNGVTLVTKVMLGVFGCVPAFDDRFTSAFRTISDEDGCRFRTFNDAALRALGNFYGQHRQTIDRLAREIGFFDFPSGKALNRCYTKAKIIDMIGFQAGKKNNSQGGRFDAAS